MNYIDLFFNLIIGLIIVWVFWGDKIVNIFKNQLLLNKNAELAGLQRQRSLI